ncbi:GAF domain-containing protein [Undibacterium sp. LX40W]|uniref:GAF domain-containing protein n=1 Tax=Undibacterium nitidum TaxID=2762298 RepID=A0A923HWT4_9BURK|nr:two-component regulator propeller domain-containing protein [Undibacterium nitidum]MBC3881606.1 GAF domain-containing protein [Undibacterium nitidum]MBC3891611.1 GAF domain-containing protein [Undibacterium sp. LX40W]
MLTHQGAWCVKLLARLQLVMLCTLLPLQESPAQDFPFIEPRFELMRDAETIDDQIITALAQDKRGFIWIGTQDGLIRYDGYRYRKFIHQTKQSNSLVGNYVYSLLAASDGRIWIGTRSDGISVFDPRTETFEQLDYETSTNKDSLSVSMVRALVEDRAGNVWIGTETGLHFYQKENKQLRNIANASPNMGLLANSVASLLIDKEGRLWLGSGRGLQRLSRDGKLFENIVVDKDITALYQAVDGKIWVGSGSYGAGWFMANSADTDTVHLHWLDRHSLKGQQLSSQWITAISEGRAEEIWLATYGGGINIVSAKDGQLLQTIRLDTSSPGSLLYDDLKPLLRDRAGWLWIGTWGIGLQRVNTQNMAIRTLKYSANRRNGLSHPDVSSVIELQDGRLLIGTSGNGIDIIDRKLGLIGGYRTHSSRDTNDKNAALSLPDKVIPALAQTKDGSIWAGTQESGLLRLQPKSQQWETITGLPDQQVRRLFSAHDGSLWIGTDHGIARWRAGNTVDVLKDEQGKPILVTVFAIIEDQEQHVWVGTDQGLWIQTRGQRSLKRVANNSATGLVSDYVQGLLLDHLGQLWVNTDKGLHRLKSWDGKVAQFDYVSGLLNQADKNLGSNLLEDQQGRIWTEDAVIDPAQMQIRFLSSADGIDAHTSWNGSCTKTRDGLLMFGGTKGIAIIDANRFTSMAPLPQIAITELKINGHAIAPGNLANSMQGEQFKLVLSPSQRDFSIEFAALDFAEPKKNRYQYRLQGYDKDWIETDADHRNAAYTSLWPGLYQLHVRASNRHGEWISQELVIPIRVLPAWWQSWWFVACILILIAGFIAALLRWREQRLQEQARHLQTLIDASTADILDIGAIGRELTSTLDTGQAFDRVYRQISSKLQVDVFFIGIVDESRAQLNLAYKMEGGRRLPDAAIKLNELHHPAVWCVQIHEDMITKQRHELSNYLGDITIPGDVTKTETMIFLPLFAGHKVIGCLSVQSHQIDAYSKEQIDLLRILASYAAIALSNSIAHSSLARSNEELADALHDLKTAQAKLIQVERQQISLDLHDNLSQTMTGILLQLDTARTVLSQEADAGQSTTQAPTNSNPAANDLSHRGLPYVDRAIELARDGITQTRYMLKQLRTKQTKPTAIDLLDTLRRDLARLVAGTPIKIKVEQSGHPIPLQAKVESAVLNVAQQAATNALRHSGAKTIRVTIAFQPDHVVLTVQDSGCGFDAHSPNFNPGIGLFGMRQRVTALSGKFHLATGIGKGTKVTASIPFIEEE